MLSTGLRGKGFVRLNPPLYNLLRFGKISKKQYRNLGGSAKRLIELDFWNNKGYKPWEVWKGYNRGNHSLGNLDRIDIMTMGGLRALYERDQIRKQNEKARRQQARSQRERGAQSDDPSSLGVSQFQREILENKDIMRTNRFRAKLFNSMFGKEK